MAIFSVMSMMTIFFLLGTASLLSTVTETKISYNYKKSIHAFYDAEAGIAVAIARVKNGWIPEYGDPNWQEYDRDGLFNYRYCSTFDPNTNIYEIISEGYDPSGKSCRRIIVELKRIFQASDITSPVYCGSSKNKGQPNRINGNSNCQGWMDDGDPNNNHSVPCIVTRKHRESHCKPCDLDYDQLITSDPNKVKYNVKELNLVDMANYYKDLPPDITSIPSGGTVNIGDPADSKVVYINGNQVVAGKLKGYGILVVTGDLRISGKMEWYGLIIVLGNNLIVTGGGAQGLHVTGAVATPNHFEIRGNADIQWCGDVIKKVVEMAGDPLTIVSWKEE